MDSEVPERALVQLKQVPRLLNHCRRACGTVRPGCWSDLTHQITNEEILLSTSTDEQNPDRSTFMRGHELGTEALPVDQYYTDEFFELEKDAIWKDSWLWIGRASDLAKPGDFFVFEFDMLHSSSLSCAVRMVKFVASIILVDIADHQWYSTVLARQSIFAALFMVGYTVLMGA
jgi:hypothetical protein